MTRLSEILVTSDASKPYAFSVVVSTDKADEEEVKPAVASFVASPTVATADSVATPADMAL